MIDIIKALFDVGKGLFGMREQIGKARRDRRDRMSEYFSQLADLIETVSASLKLHKYPDGSCQQLYQLALLMKKTLKGLVEPEEAEGYQKKLLEIWEIERLFDQLNGLPDEKILKRLKKLDEAAGYFRAVAAHLRV